MKFDDVTLQVLRNFSSINPGLQFRKGNVLRTIAPSKTVFATAYLVDEIEDDFLIYDISKLLGVISLFDDPDLEVGDKALTINGPNRKVKYYFAAPDTVVVPPDKTLKQKSSDVSFVLHRKTLKDLMKATGVLSLPNIGVIGEGGDIILRAFDAKNPTSDTYDVAIKPGAQVEDFKKVFKIENLKLLEDDYEVSIDFDSFAEFKGNVVTYAVAMES